MGGNAGIGSTAGGTEGLHARAWRGTGMIGAWTSGTRMLASVTGCEEAEMCLGAGVDVIDCKDPANGALGALSYDVVTGICRRVSGRAPVSATIGDLPCRTIDVLPAATAMAETGCDIVKVGLLPGGEPEDVIKRLGAEFAARGDQQRRVGLVAVMFADMGPVDLGLIPLMRCAGFCGAMLDTANKTGGRLTNHLDSAALSRFIEAAHEADMFAGLAGSLRVEDVDCLLALKADILGFRGGLCVNGLRGFGLDEQALRAVRRAIGSRKPAGPDIVQAERAGR